MSKERPSLTARLLKEAEEKNLKLEQRVAELEIELSSKNQTILDLERDLRWARIYPLEDE